MQTTHAIEFKDVNAGYHNAPVLNNVSFSIPKGQIAAVIGPNGAGKTTIFKVITGLIRPSVGTVRVFGEDILGMTAQRRATLVGVVPQALDTTVAFTIEEIVTTGRVASMGRWRPPSPDDRRAIERAMTYTDVVDMKHRPVNELSGGEKQRAVIAMVLAQQPKLILMDEATSHLDMNHQLEVMQIVERLNREDGVTVVMISHDLNTAAEFCEHLLLFDQGRLVADGRPQDVLTRDILRRTYHCDVRVTHDAANGSVTVTPTPRLSADRSGAGRHVHVISGGGTGEEVIRRLSLCDYIVTCGVLNDGDIDAGVAEALGLKTVLEKPFSPIGREAVARATEMTQGAAAVVICGVPFGTGNVANLELALHALEQGTQVLVMAKIEDRDYTPDKDAAAIAEKLLARGATPWNSIADLEDLLAGSVRS